MEDLRLALAFAKKGRTCPPLQVMQDPGQKEAVERHLSVCPYCSAGRLEDLEPWAELVKEWKRALSEEPHLMGPKSVLPGQIRLIRPELGCWREAFYYTPPAVLVLEKIPGITGGFRVAQVFFDPSMAAPGDLVVDHERSGTGDLMLECWNTYPIKAEHLGPLLGSISDGVLQDALKMVQDPAAVPEWAVHPRRMREHDPRIYFRELETEVQYVFASAAVAEMLAELERKSLVETASEIVDFLKKKFGELRVPPWADDPQTVLAAAELPLEGLALAAAGADGRRSTPATLVILENGRVREVRPVLAEIELEGSAETGRFVLGVVPAAAQIDEDSWVHCLLLRPGKVSAAASSIDWEPATGKFMARFEGVFEGEGQFKMAVFCRLK